MGCGASHFVVQGDVQPGYEEVMKKFEQNFVKGIDKNSQLCVYVGDQKVVDVWGETPTSSQVYTPDKVTTIWSAGKSLGAIMMAIMRDQGKIEYDEKVSKYWPEFAQNGKENITVADVLRHEGGLDKFDETMPNDYVLTENIKQNKIGAVIEKSTPFWRKGSRRIYHAVTKDWITNEIFRRVEPQGRTMGEYFKQEIEKKHNVDVYLRMDEADLVKAVDYKYIGMWKQYKNAKVPWDECRYSTIPMFDMKAMMDAESKENKLCKNEQPKTYDPARQELKSFGMDTMNNKTIRMGESVSAACLASARGLAKIAQFMANRGKADGQQLISEESWEDMHAEPKEVIEFPMGMVTYYTKGGLNRFTHSDKHGDAADEHKNPYFVKANNCTKEVNEQANNKRDGWYGWMGFGGAVLQWHPEYNIGFAYVPQDLFMCDLVNLRAAVLQELVMDAVKKQGQTTNIV